jgi:hypothetical protein
VLTTVDKSAEAEGIVTMTVGYTGTQDEAREARNDALRNELQARAATPQLSSIRDHTGSGVGHNPDTDGNTAGDAQQEGAKVGCYYTPARHSQFQAAEALQLHDVHPSVMAGHGD